MQTVRREESEGSREGEVTCKRERLLTEHRPLIGLDVLHTQIRSERRERIAQRSDVIANGAVVSVVQTRGAARNGRFLQHIIRFGDGSAEMHVCHFTVCCLVAGHEKTRE
jgi:hypothetical protein